MGHAARNTPCAILPTLGAVPDEADPAKRNAGLRKAAKPINADFRHHRKPGPAQRVRGKRAER